MDSKDAIKWFENRIKNGTMPGARSMYAMALTALREQEERENPKPLAGWISVKDKLPEHYTRCLVYRYDRVTKTHFIDFLWFCAGIWRVGPDYGVADDTVTHWMPLPEPPKEDA